MDAKSQFSTRLKEAIAAAGLDSRPTTLEKLFNLHYQGSPVTYQGVRRWLLGLSIPEQDKLEVLAELLGTDTAFLRYGRRKSNGDEPRKHKPSAAAAIGLYDRVAIDAFLQLPKASRDVVRQIIGVLASHAKKCEHD
jgi:hypothetical protein